MKQFMYFMGILPLLLEIAQFMGFQPTKFLKKLETWKQSPHKDLTTGVGLVLNAGVLIIIAIWYYIWIVWGLFTPQWLWFLPLLIAGLLMPKSWRQVRWVQKVDAGTSIAIILKIIIFHT